MEAGRSARCVSDEGEEVLEMTLTDTEENTLLRNKRRNETGKIEKIPYDRGFFGI